MEGPGRSVDVMAANSGAAADKGARLLGVPRSAVDVRWVRVAGQDASARLKKYRVVARRQDGAFSLQLEGDGLMLTVAPPQRAGRAVALAEVEAELELWPLTQIDTAALRGAVIEMRDQPVPVASLQPCYSAAQGPAEGLAVLLTADEALAYILPSGPAVEAPLSADDVREVLRQAGVVSGLDDETIAAFVAEALRSRPVVVARGTPAQPAEAFVVPVFGTGETPRDVAVELGAPLLAIESGGEALPGVTVTGVAIESDDGEWPSLDRYAGPGTEVAPDGLSVIATVIGVATFDGERASVKAVDSVGRRASAIRGQSGERAPSAGARTAARPADAAQAAGRPIFGPDRKWVELSAASPQIAVAIGAELLGLTPAEVEARQIAGAAPLRRPGEGDERRPPMRYRVQPSGSEGRFLLEARDDGLYLTVWPPQGSGRAVTWGRLQTALSHWPPLALSQARIEQSLREAVGQPTRVALAGWTRVPCGAGAIGVAVSADEMVAHALALGGLRGAAVDEAAVLKALAQAKVTHGIIRPEVALFCRDAERVRPVILALGTPPGEVSNEPEYLFPRDDRPPADVRPGDVVARVPGDVAGAGRTVTGTPIAPPSVRPRPLHAFVGEGVAILADGQSIVALTSGRPTLVHGQVSVLPHERVAHTLKGESVFAGSVTVAATAAGATVRARGDVAVESDVEDLFVEAGGSVRLRGVRGGGKSRISAGDSVAASWLDACLVMVRDTLQVSAELVQSTVLAARRVLVRGDGLITGGLIRATEEIVVHTILAGDEGNPTRIVLGKLGRGSAERSVARLVVHGEIEPGVRISIDGATLEVSEPIQRSVLRQRGGVIQVEPLGS